MLFLTAKLSLLRRSSLVDFQDNQTSSNITTTALLSLPRWSFVHANHDDRPLEPVSIVFREMLSDVELHKPSGAVEIFCWAADAPDFVTADQHVDWSTQRTPSCSFKRGTPAGYNEERLDDARYVVGTSSEMPWQVHWAIIFAFDARYVVLNWLIT